MKEIVLGKENQPISLKKVEESVDKLFANYDLDKINKILVIPPDYTRCYSMAGEITKIIYEKYNKYFDIDIMPAVGTHMPVSDEERIKMFGSDIPKERFLVHDWRKDTVSIGTVPKELVSEISEGLFATDIEVEVNKKLVSGEYDLIISVGQVVPHEVVGMANYSKNIFVGVGGRQMINKSHMLSAICGMEKAMGKEKTPARMVFDYAQENFLKDIPLVYMLTVTTEKNNEVFLNGLYIGDTREVFEEAVKLSQKLNITYLDRSVKKVVAYLDEYELKTTWVGNKGVYRTRMAIEDGGELILLAPGVRNFGENDETDAQIRKYGYKGRDYVLDLFNKDAFGDSMMVAAHLIQGSTDGRFKVTYATNTDYMTKEEIESVGYEHMDIEEAYKLYDPKKLKEGFNTLENGEEIYFVRTPALGLWIAKDRM
jgi:nickel-dependent lactate racemase